MSIFTSSIAHFTHVKVSKFFHLMFTNLWMIKYILPLLFVHTHVDSVRQVCDSEWHHLSLSVQFPSVTLYVDGVTFDPALIHDNGAIPNPAPHQRMSIGACWGKKWKEFMQSEFRTDTDFIPS